MARKGNKAKKHHIDFFLIILLALSAIFMLSVVRYAGKTLLGPEWDEQHYMRMATEFYRMVKNFSPETPYHMLQVVPFRQPGYPFLVLPFLMIFGLSKYYFWGQFVNGLMYVTTILAVFFLAKMYLTRLSSFMAAVIFAFYGWTLFFVHLAYSETTTSAFCLLSVLFLLKSNLFRSRTYSILFGVATGYALLTRWLSVVIISGPFLYVLYLTFREKLMRKNAAHMLTAIVLMSLIIGYPYYSNFHEYVTVLFNHRVGGVVWESLPDSQQQPISFYSATFYLNVFSQLGIWYFFLITAGVILALRRSSRLKPIFLAAFFSWIFFSFFSILKGDRYIIPIYPYLAVLSGSVFDYIKNLKVKYALVAITIILSLGTFLGTDWGKGPFKTGLVQLGNAPIYLTSVTRPPYIYTISGPEIIDYIEDDSQKNSMKDTTVTELFYYHYLNEPMMTHNLYSKEKPLQMVSFVGTVLPDPEKSAPLINAALSSDYLLIKTGMKIDDSVDEANTKTLQTLIQVVDNDFEIENYFEKKKTFYIFQDKSEITVWKKIEQIPENEVLKLEKAFKNTF